MLDDRKPDVYPLDDPKTVIQAIQLLRSEVQSLREEQQAIKIDLERFHTNWEKYKPILDEMDSSKERWRQFRFRMMERIANTILGAILLFIAVASWSYITGVL